MLLELAPQELGVGGFAAETGPVLCQHHEDAASSYEVPHAVHTWPLKACATLSGVRYLLEDLVAFAACVGSEGLKLLGRVRSLSGLAHL